MLVNKLWKKMEKVEREKRDLEARLGATPPPSPNDKNSPAFLNTRILQLSEQVSVLRRQLEKTDAKSESWLYPLCVCVFSMSLI